jgi:hypothetical protein
METIVNVTIKEKKGHFCENCPDCGSSIGEPHKEGCHIELCTVCGRKRHLDLETHGTFFSCAFHDKQTARWMGYFPFVEESDIRFVLECGERLDQLSILLSRTYNVLDDLRTHLSEVSSKDKNERFDAFEYIEEGIDYVLEDLLGANVSLMSMERFQSIKLKRLWEEEFRKLPWETVDRMRNEGNVNMKTHVQIRLADRPTIVLKEFVEIDDPEGEPDIEVCEIRNESGKALKREFHDPCMRFQDEFTMMGDTL